MRIGVATLLSLLYLANAGCAWLQPEGHAPLPGGGWWQPLSPALLSDDFNALQRVDAEFDGHRIVWLFYLEKQGDALALAATTPDGSELFQLTQQGTAVTITTSPLLPSQWRPEVVLMELQLALWPADAIAANLPAGLQWQATDKGFELRRGNVDEHIVEIVIKRARNTPWQEPVQLMQQRNNYRYTVTPLELETLESK